MTDVDNAELMRRFNEVADRLPCGCRIGTLVIDGEPSYIHEPCSLDCTFYRFAVEESKKAKKPVKFRG